MSLCCAGEGERDPVCQTHGMRPVVDVVSGMWSPSRTETSPNLHNRARSLSLDSASGKITCTHVYPLGVVSEGKINKVHRKAVLS